jgi:hypothetical protein
MSNAQQLQQARLEAALKREFKHLSHELERVSEYLPCGHILRIHFKPMLGGNRRPCSHIKCPCLDFKCANS